MTDIERIRRDLVACRDIPWSCSCVEPEQLAALVEEVERLRGERAAVVAMLRGYANSWGTSPDEKRVLHWAVRHIERGKHRRGEGA